jgi:hypothetical protein
MIPRLAVHTFSKTHPYKQVYVLVNSINREITQIVKRQPQPQTDRPRPTTLLPPRSNSKPEAATEVYKLQMMGKRMPETC